MSIAFTLIGQAGLDVRLGTTRVVCDPWLSNQGAYLETWHPAESTPIAAAALADASHLFFGSPEPDHVDASTLEAFPRGVRLLIPTFPSRALGERLRGMGFTDVVELADGVPFDLGGGARLQVVLDPVKQDQRAAAIFEAEGVTLVHQGDARLDDQAAARLAALHPQVHVLRLWTPAYAAAGLDGAPPAGFPTDPGAVLARLVSSARAVGAAHVVPTAGPVALGAAALDLAALQARFEQEAPELAARTHWLAPGGVASHEGEAWRFQDSPAADPTADAARATARSAARAQRLAALRAEASAFDDKKERASLRELFLHEDMLWDMKDVLLQIVLADGPPVWVDFRKRPVRYVLEHADPPTHLLVLERAWMSAWIAGKTTWRELLLAGLATLRHAGDNASGGLAAHLDYRHDLALFEVLRRLNPATLTIQDEQNEYVVQRFCPHLGRDLEYAVVERGVLTCTAHGWRFDLRKGGRCLWGGDTPLRVQEIRPLKR